MKRGKIVKLFVLLLAVSLLCQGGMFQAVAAPQTSAASKTAAASTTVTVSTQKELDKALNEKKSGTITIRTDKKVKFVIPAKQSAKNKKLVVNAPKAVVENKAVFSGISLTGNGAASFTENGKDNKITVTSGKAAITVGKSGSVKLLEVKSQDGNITIQKGGKVAKLVTAKKDLKVKLVVNGSLTELAVLNKSNVTLSGTAKNIKVTVQAEGTQITSSVSLKVVLEKKAAITLKKGAENTKIDLVSSKVDGTIVNQTKSEITVAADGKKIAVKPGSSVASLLKEYEQSSNSNSTSTDNGSGNGSGEGSGTGNSTGNGSGTGTGNGTGNGTDNGTGNGTGNGNGTGTGSGTGNGTDNGTGNGTGNGNGTDNGNGSGTDNGNGTGVDSSYHLAWSDEFTGDTLNAANWVTELREPGWTNNELQQYTDSPDNVYVENGTLVLKAKKTVVDGKTEYTSGKITTLGKQKFKYGRFEVRAKVPKGQGLWPAAWMMPADESFYGQWPKCGEIDIMEILGHEPDKAYGTIHYGNPHGQSQGTYTLKDGTFADDFHVYAMEWEPGELRFYIDGVLYHKVNDWFTKTEGDDEITYPAPFDQPFIMQMNLAVGGDWPGSPDESTDFDNAKLQVDYVRVYQKDSYNENVTKPAKPVVLREPDATGNYVNGGNFQTPGSLADNSDWTLLTALGGAATGEVNGNAVTITTTDMGTADYSVQLVQPGMPMKQGGTYRLTFDAKAAEARKMFVTVSAPDKGWKRYLADTPVSLDVTKQSYSYDFFITGVDDANGRLEFNLGNQGSTAAVEISNIRLEKISQTDVTEDTTKTVRSDGNYVYNGQFQVGDDRMKYWEAESQVPGSNVSVTNLDGVRELKAVVPEGVSSLEAVKVKQAELGIGKNTSYKLAFDGYGAEDKTVAVRINGEEFSVPITSQYTHYEFKFTTGETLNNKDLEFLLGAPGTTYLDNVRLTEDRLVSNGDFNQDLSSWEFFTDSSISGKTACEVNGVTGENAAAINIKDTGDQEWKIQLKQNNIKLEKGKWYKLTLDAKSTLDRKIKFALQRDGSSDNEWTAYAVKEADLKSGYGTYEISFQMAYDTDVRTILTISMGAVNNQITEEHTVYIDHVILKEIEEPIIEHETELIKNGDFTDADSHWTAAITAPGAADASFTEKKASFHISAVGDQDWNIQLKQSGLLLENGKTYKVKADFLSSVDRTVKIAFLTAVYAWYGGSDISLQAGVPNSVEFNITVAQPTSLIDFIISMGKIAGEETQPGTIDISNISVTEAE